MTNSPLQVYRRNKDRKVVYWAPASQPTPDSNEAPPNSMDISSTSDLLIALRKGTRSCTKHPISNFFL